MGKKKYKNPTTEVVDGKIRDNKCYKTWNHMLTRCYSKKYHEKSPTYIGCSVCDEWHDYDVFYEWFQDNYREGFHLDKDILVQGNKVYGPNTCVFVPQEINKLILKCDARRGKLPLGVSYHIQNNNYIAHTRINGKIKHLGSFEEPLSAHQAYCTAKYKEIKRVAENALKIGDIDNRVYEALLNYIINER